jgi:hypothetical protein
VEYDRIIPADTAFELTRRSLSMFAGLGETAPPEPCAAGDGLERSDPKAWHDWRETVGRRWRRVSPVVNERDDVISVAFYVWVSKAEADYIQFNYRSDVSDATGWSFKCWRADVEIIVCDSKPSGQRSAAVEGSSWRMTFQRRDIREHGIDSRMEDVPDLMDVEGSIPALRPLGRENIHLDQPGHGQLGGGKADLERLTGAGTVITG